MNLLTQFAQIAESNPALFTYGPLGIFTAWLMWRDERRAIQVRETEMKNAEIQRDVMHRIDGLSKALLMDKMESETSSPYVRKYARDAIAKIDARTQKDAQCATGAR